SGEPERLAPEHDGGETLLLSRADQGRKIDVRGEILAANVAKRIAVRPVMAETAERAVKADAAVHQLRLGKPIVAGDQQAAVEPSGKIAVERPPAGGEVGDLAGGQVDVRT